MVGVALSAFAGGLALSAAWRQRERRLVRGLLVLSPVFAIGAALLVTDIGTLVDEPEFAVAILPPLSGLALWVVYGGVLLVGRLTKWVGGGT